MECRLEFLYYVLRGNAEYVSFHRHDCYELVYYLNGSGTTRIGDASYAYSPNTFTLIRPDCSHDELHHEDTDILFIGFSYHCADRTDKIQLENGLYQDDREHSILACLEQMKSELSSQKRHYKPMLDLLLQNLLIRFDRMQENPACKENSFTYIEKFIQENYSRHIDLKVLAQLSGYSYHHFRHIFKKATGFSPIQYIINQRMAKARHLLRETDLSILTISQESGFSNQSQFCCMFRQETGVTPGRFRKNKTNDV